MLRNRWSSADSLLWVGLDRDPGKFPAGMRGTPDSIARFCIDIVDATAEVACAFKPQIACVAAAGAPTGGRVRPHPHGAPRRSYIVAVE